MFSNFAKMSVRRFSDIAAKKPIQRAISMSGEKKRHMTPDGRVSLKQHLLGPRSGGGAFKIFASQMNAATWPLIIVIGGGCGLAAFQCLRHATSSPDVQWDKSNRANPMQYSEENGKSWISHKPAAAKFQ